MAIEQNICDLTSAAKELRAAVITLTEAMQGFADRFPVKAEQAAERRTVIRKDGTVKTVPADEPATLAEKMAKRKATGKPEYQPRIQKTSRVIPAGQISGEAEAEQAPAPEVKAAPAPAPAPEAKAAPAKEEKPAPAKAEQAPAKAEQAPAKENPFGKFPIALSEVGEKVTEEQKKKLCEKVFPWLQHAVTVDKAAVIGLFGKYSQKDEKGMPTARNPLQLPAETFAAFLADCARLGA